jgi:hypothetical protein
MNRRETIEAVICDMVTDLFVYNRKEDEDLPRGAIEDAVRNKEISGAEIIHQFATLVIRHLGEAEAP